MANLGPSGIITWAPHPHAALLFLDYLHSKEGRAVLIKWGLSSPHEDVGSLEQRFKKVYLEAQYSPEGLDKKFSKWLEEKGEKSCVEGEAIPIYRKKKGGFLSFTNAPAFVLRKIMGPSRP